jgi:RNA polymerase sigma factor (sigma-70 family)
MLQEELHTTMKNLGFDRKAGRFTEIYSDYYSLVYSTVFSKVSNEDDVEDLCQEIFSRFYEKFDQVENPRKWLLGTLRYVILEHYRRKTGKEVNIEDVFDDINLTFVNGFRDSRLMIEEALENIGNYESEKDKLIFDLISIYNFTYREVGDHLGLTERQVRYKYSLTTKNLLDFFKKRGISHLEDLL